MKGASPDAAIADLVATGDMTTEQANEWHARKADAWAMEG